MHLTSPVYIIGADTILQYRFSKAAKLFVSDRLLFGLFSISCHAHEVVQIDGLSRRK